MEMAMASDEYLKKPYGRVVIPDDDGSFRAEIVEFPGCIAVGDTAAEALANLESVAISWLEASIERGQRIPEPIESVGFSGKFMLRLPKSLHKKTAHAAARDGVSLNAFISNCVAEAVGERSRPAATFQLQRTITNMFFMPTTEFYSQRVQIGTPTNETMTFQFGNRTELEHA
jgi:antitoxin HicB